VDHTIAAKPRKRSGSQNRHRQAVLATRLTQDELDQIRRTAEAKGKSVSEYVRGLVLAATA